MKTTRRTMTRFHPHFAMVPLVILSALFAGGCEGSATPDPSPPETTGVVDSIFPMDEELRRFREGMDPIDALTGGTESRDTLVETFIAQLGAADTLGLASLAITPAEFAWVYFPHSMYMSPPYELPPGVVWFQLQNRSSRGLSRALTSLGGETLYYTGYDCPDEGERWGEGHIWHECTVLGTLPDGEAVEQKLFGSILEWRGRFKFVSYSNEL